MGLKGNLHFITCHESIEEVLRYRATLSLTPALNLDAWATPRLEELSKGENIVKWIKGQRISWLGHLERMEEDRMPKKIFNQELEGTRRRGRPRKGWREKVERVLQMLGVIRWRELVIDGEKWRGVV